MASAAITLNPAQQRAVTAGDGATVILAGPGSGKTRVIVNRIAHLVKEAGVPAPCITAVTFTNKAREEMHHRLSGDPALKGVTVSTFHRVCLKLLHQHGEAAGVPPTFTIADRSEQVATVKRVLAMSPQEGVTADDALSYVADCKNLGLLADEARKRFLAAKTGPRPAPPTEGEEGEDGEEVVVAPAPPKRDNEAQLVEVFAGYEAALADGDKLDFDDLLVRAVRLLERNPVVSQGVASAIRHLLVDEFQDTNQLQYRLIRQLAKAHKNLFVVGDPDQCIYTWRHASPENMGKLQRDHPGCQVILLEQNYRSTASILHVANSIISTGTYTRKLWTTRGGTSPVVVALFASDREESEYIAEQLATVVATAKGDVDACVLTRTAAMARGLEQALVRVGVAYKLVGGTRLFDHAEIKDLVAYLSLAQSPGDVEAFKRAVKAPKLGFGTASCTALVAHAAAAGKPILTAASSIMTGSTVQGVSKESWRALGPLVRAVKRLQVSTAAGSGVSLADAISTLITDIKFHAYLQREFPDGEDRITRVKDFVACADTFEKDVLTDGVFVTPSQPELYAPEGGAGAAATPPSQLSQGARWLGVSPPKPKDRRNARLPFFLQHIMIASDTAAPEASNTNAAKAGAGTVTVTLSTVHAAKGMEWDVVFIPGCESGVFPHSRCVAGDGDAPTASEREAFDEERRLLYVAATRARSKLYLTRAVRRVLAGKELRNPVSPFLGKLPADHIETVLSATVVGAGKGDPRDGCGPAAAMGTVNPRVVLKEVQGVTLPAPVGARGFVGARMVPRRAGPVVTMEAAFTNARVVYDSVGGEGRGRGKGKPPPQANTIANMFKRSPPVGALTVATTTASVGVPAPGRCPSSGVVVVKAMEGAPRPKPAGARLGAGTLTRSATVPSARRPFKRPRMRGKESSL